MLDFLFASPLITGIIGAVVLLALVAFIIVSRMKVAGPNQA
jgi:flotillin